MTQDRAKGFIKFSKNTWNKGKLQNVTGRGLGGQRGQDIGLDKHRATHMRLDGYRARQSLVALSAHCANSYILHVQHIIQYICAAGCRNSWRPVAQFEETMRRRIILKCTGVA